MTDVISLNNVAQDAQPAHIYARHLAAITLRQIPYL